MEGSGPESVAERSRRGSTLRRTFGYYCRLNNGLLKRMDSADVIKLRILRWGNYLTLSRWAQCNHNGPRKRKAGGSETETEIGRCYTAGFEDRGKEP